MGKKKEEVTTSFKMRFPLSQVTASHTYVESKVLLMHSNHLLDQLPCPVSHSCWIYLEGFKITIMS